MLLTPSLATTIGEASRYSREETRTGRYKNSERDEEIAVVPCAHKARWIQHALRRGIILVLTH